MSELAVLALLVSLVFTEFTDLMPGSLSPSTSSSIWTTR